MVVVISSGIVRLCVFRLPGDASSVYRSPFGEKQLMQQTYRYKALKSKKEVFEALLEKSESYEVSSADSSVFLGNPEAPLTVTVLTNPHCNPCARMHARLEKVLKEAHGRIAVQYIFSSFNEELRIAVVS